MQQNNLRGFTQPSDGDRFPGLKAVATVGYASLAGARCPDCRNASSEAALSAIPWPDSDNPIETLVFQGTYLGRPDEFPTDWSRAWVEAAQSRGLAPGTYGLTSLTEAAPRSGRARDGRPVWAFAHRLFYDSNSGGVSSTYVHRYICLDAQGLMERRSTRVTREAGLFRKAETNTVVEWVPAALPPDRDKGDGRNVRSMLLAVLAGNPHDWEWGLRIPSGDQSWMGLDPEGAFHWLAERRPSRS